MPHELERTKLRSQAGTSWQTCRYNLSRPFWKQLTKGLAKIERPCTPRWKAEMAARCTLIEDKERPSCFKWRR